MGARMESALCYFELALAPRAASEAALGWDVCL